MRKAKTLISIFLTVLMVISMLSVGFAVSASAAAGNVFYFEKPENWGDSIYVHYWGTSQDTQWPGDEMTKLNDKYYSYTCPVNVKDMVITDGEGLQTSDITFGGNNKMAVITTQGGTNSSGNPVWNAKWVDFPGLGLSVSASPANIDFVDSVDVKLSVNSAVSAEYTINNASAKSFTDGEIITIGEDANVGDVINLTLTASDGSSNVSKTYSYTKASSPSGSMAVYFDNSLGYETPHIYAWGAKEFSKWPGEKMLKDEKSGLYYYVFTDEKIAYENIIINDGKDGEKDPTAQQYPEKGSFNIKKGECKFLTNGEWIDYGKPDSSPAGFVYTPSGTKFSTDVLTVELGLKNAVSGTYSIDGGSEIPFKQGDTVQIGEGVIGNTDITLTLKATDGKKTETNNYTFTKTFTVSRATFSSSSDGHTTEALGGYYSTNPNLQLGKNKTITVDGKADEWDESMIIAQGVANDDARVYMSSSVHERAWDDYALYAAWDDDNLYFMWEMANTSSIISGDNNIFSAQKPNGSPWNPGAPVFLALSVDPTKSGEGKAKETDKKTGNVTYSDFVWGGTDNNGQAGGIAYETNVDKIVAFDTANTNGGSAVISLDDDGYFNYDTSVPIGRPNNNPGTLNQNGFQIAWDYGTLSKNLFGINGYGGSREIGDTYSADSNWIDFFDLGYKADSGFIYEVAIPFETLGIDKSYIENNGLGVMKISTMGYSGLNSLPMDPSMIDNADAPYSYDPSTSAEKEDIDRITVPLARVGKLLPDTVITPAQFQVNFGAEKSSPQPVSSQVTLKAQAYNGSGNYTYDFSVNGESIARGAQDTAVWTPTEKGQYQIAVTVQDDNGNIVTSNKTYTIGDEVEEPPTNPTDPTDKLGDVNFDGEVDLKDILLIQKEMAELITFSERERKVADVNKDGNVDLIDVLQIQKYMAEIITEF